MPKNALYAQSGGVTSVINASACGLIEAARENKIKVFAGHNGVTGVLSEDLIDTSKESNQDIAALHYTPSGAFGSCRYKLKDIEKNNNECKRLIEVFAAHNIGYFFYNGGGDSQDTIYKISCFSQQAGYPLICIGIPKTIDNDLPFTDCCPGFGSAAKYVATSICEASFDILSMAATSTKVFILEVMGRHTGWLAAAGGLASKNHSNVNGAPQIILFPEIAFNQELFLQRVELCIKKYGFCSIVVSEGVRNEEGKFLSDCDLKDAFGHTQLGGAGTIVAQMIRNNLKYKCQLAIANYLQRSARHIASKVDIEQSYAVGKAALELALKGKNNIMTTIVRESDKPYRWSVGSAPLEQVANMERKMPRSYITEDGFHITEECLNYLTPLIQGEDFPAFENGLPKYVRLRNNSVPKKLGSLIN